MCTPCRAAGLILVVLALCLSEQPAQARYSGGAGEPNDPYQIATAEDLMLLGETPEDYDKHFILTADIDLDPNLPGRKVFDRAVIAPDTEPNDEWGEFKGTPFTGVFDGDHHTISNLNVTGGDHVGLFGCLERRSEVKDLNVIDANLVGSGDCVGGLAGSNSGNLTRCHNTGFVTGEMHDIGGLVGSNSGTLTDCSSSSVVVGKGWQRFTRGDQTGVAALVGTNSGLITRCSSTGVVTGDSHVGGLVGENYQGGNVIQCCSRASVNSIYASAGGLVGNDRGFVTDCYSTGAAHGDGWVWVGGLVGGNSDDGTVSRCYCTGSVSKTPRGVETPQSMVGGLVGGNWGHIGSSFWDIQTSGQATSAGGTGKTTAEMQMDQTFLDAGWDFVGETDNGTDDIWWILEGQDYPRLWWELIPQN